VFGLEPVLNPAILAILSGALAVGVLTSIKLVVHLSYYCTGACGANWNERRSGTYALWRNERHILER